MTTRSLVLRVLASLVFGIGAGLVAKKLLNGNPDPGTTMLLVLIVATFGSLLFVVMTPKSQRH